MAKTKRNNKIDAKVTQQPISYKGNVKLKVQKNGLTVREVKISNSGTMLLFQGLGRFLLGQFANSSSNLLNQNMYIPRYLGVGRQTTLTPTDPLTYRLYNEYDFGSRFILTSGNTVVDTQAKTVIAPFKVTIPYSSVSNSRITELGLFTSAIPNTSDLLARVNIPPEIEGEEPGIKLDVGMSLFIEWNIVIQNMV